jgi:hypothetical protein
VAESIARIVWGDSLTRNPTVPDRERFDAAWEMSNDMLADVPATEAATGTPVTIDAAMAAMTELVSVLDDRRQDAINSAF